MKRLLTLVCLFGAVGLSGCLPAKGGDDMSQTVTLKARGYFSDPNALNLPEGALIQADNAQTTRDNIVEQERGRAGIGYSFGGGSDRANKVIFFKDVLLAHYGTTKLTRDTGSAFSDYSGSYTAPTGYRMQFAEAQQDLFFTTNAGVYMLDSLTGTPTLAGVPKAIHLTASLVGTAGTALAANAAVGYRVVWGKRDVNGRPMLGSPSGREVISNPAGLTSAAGQVSRTSNVVTVNSPSAHGLKVGQVVTLLLGAADATFSNGNKTVASIVDSDTWTYAETAANAISGQTHTYTPVTTDVTVTVAIPDEITTSHFAQVYRTKASSGASVDPGDTMYQCYEYVPNNVDITNKSFSFPDIAPDSTLGNALYTNSDQQGILQANDQPPIAYSSMTTFRGSMFYGHTECAHSITIQMLSPSLDAAIGFHEDSEMSPGTINEIFYLFPATAEDSTNGIYKVFTDGSVSQNIENTAKSFVRVINEYPASAGELYATYVSSPNDPPGIITIYRRAAVKSKWFSISCSSGSPSLWNPRIPPVRPGVNFSRTSNVVTVIFTTAHYFSVGQRIVLRSAPSADFPAGLKIVASVPTSTTLTYSEVGANSSTVNPAYLYEEGKDFDYLKSSSSAAKNGLSYSKTDQPEAVPFTNQLYLGSADESLLAQKAIRDSLYIFKEDGVFRVTGDSPATFRGSPAAESSAILYGPETVVRLGDEIYALTSQGVVQVSETGVTVISKQIEKDLLALFTANLSSVKSLSYGVAYETERKYSLYTISSANDTQVTQVFTYNAAENTWGKRTLVGRYAMVSPANDKLYEASTSTNTVYVERKSRTAADFQDENGAGIPFAIKYAPVTGGNPGVQKQFIEASAFFESPQPATVTVGFASNISTNEETISVATSSTGVARTLVPREKARASQLTVGISHSTAQEAIKIQGLSVKFEPYSERVSR